jgi:hypothetical protein
MDQTRHIRLGDGLGVRQGHSETRVIGKQNRYARLATPPPHYPTDPAEEQGYSQWFYDKVPRARGSIFL